MRKITTSRIRVLGATAAALAIGFPVTAQADETAERPSRVSGIAQVDLSNAYYFRGIKQERDGIIVQPWAELYLNLYQAEDGPIRDVSIGAGVWNSIHGDGTLAEHSPTSIYETDWYPLISIGLPGGLTWTTTYYFYTSPNGAFSTAQELNFKLAWDDSETLGRFALAPWANLAYETDRTAFGDRKGVGVQMGIAPTLYAHDDERFPIEVTFPIELGLSIDDYYEETGVSNDTFGYLSWGLSVRIPLGFLDPSWGAWAVTAVGKGYTFGDSLEEANGGDELQAQGVGSLSLEF